MNNEIEITEYSDESVRIETQKYSQLVDLFDYLKSNENLSVNVLKGHKRNGGKWNYTFDLFLRNDNESPFMKAKDTDFWIDFTSYDTKEDVKEKLNVEIEPELHEDIISEWESLELSEGETARIFWDYSRGVDYVVTSESVGYSYDTHSYKIILEVEYKLDFDKITDYINEILIRPNELVTIWINADHELKYTRGSMEFRDNEIIELLSLRFMDEVPDEIEVDYVEHEINQEFEKSKLINNVLKEWKKWN